MTRGPRHEPLTTRSRSIFVDAAIALILFGCIPVVVKYISANAWTIGIFRLVVASAGVFLFARLRGPFPRLGRGDLLALFAIGVVFFLHWTTYFLSIKISSASIGAIGLSTYGIDLLILGAIFGHSRLRAIDLVAVLLAVAGAVAIVPEFTLRDDTTVGMLLACISAVFYAALPILHQRFAHISSTMRAMGQFSFALVLFLLFLPKSDWHLRPVDWAGLTFLAVGSTLIGHSLWVRVTTKLSPATTSVIYYGNVPVAIALSVAVLREPLRPRLVAGALLIIGGGILGLTSQWRRGAIDAGKLAGPSGRN